jgi:membrane associated rhomboid family serine protease
MKPGTGFDVSGASFPCPMGILGTARNGTACFLKDVCRFGGLTNGEPDQWWRLITACFLHGGILHLLMNLSFQIHGGFDLEKDMGWWRMALIYMTSGVGGFMFGASLGDIRTASVGASGSLYGIKN